MNKLQIVYKKVEELIPYVNNPRKNDHAVDKVASSIKNYGFKVPIVLDSKNEIITGHTRLKASLKLGLEEVPCIIADDLTEAQIKAFRIADNRVGEEAEWDKALLALEIEGLNELDFNIGELGFDIPELNNILKNENEVKEDDFDLNVEKIKQVYSKRGDIWLLGQHRLMCGDSLVIDEIFKIIDDQHVEMVFTDPPYDMQMGGQGCFSECTKNVKKRIDNIINFDVNKLTHLKDLDINTFYICTSKNGIKDYLRIFDDYNFNILVWCKTNPTPFTSGTFLPDMEYILYFANSNRIWNNSLKPTEIYKKYYISAKEFGRKDVGNIHPTMKPIELIGNRILISSNINGIVLDLFGGSGSTLIACEQLDRKCFMMELDEKYVDVIVNRYNKYIKENNINKKIKLIRDSKEYDIEETKVLVGD